MIVDSSNNVFRISTQLFVSEIVGKSSLLGFEASATPSKPPRLPVQEHMLLPSGMTENQSMPKPVIGNRIQRSVVSMDKSLLAGKHNLLMDIGLFHARKFRIGWGPRSVTVYLAQQSDTDNGS